MNTSDFRGFEPRQEKTAYIVEMETESLKQMMIIQMMIIEIHLFFRVRSISLD